MSTQSVWTKIVIKEMALRVITNGGNTNDTDLKRFVLEDVISVTSKALKKSSFKK